MVIQELGLKRPCQWWILKPKSLDRQKYVTSWQLGALVRGFRPVRCVLLRSRFAGECSMYVYTICVC